MDVEGVSLVIISSHTVSAIKKDTRVVVGDDLVLQFSFPLNAGIKNNTCEVGEGVAEGRGRVFSSLLRLPQNHRRGDSFLYIPQQCPE